MTDTEMTLGTQHLRLDRSCRRKELGVRLLGAFLIASLALLAASPARATAQPAPLDAHVVSVRGPHAYIAARDSLALAPFSLLTFTIKSKPIATGEVERLVDGGMAVARITSGSLAGVKKLGKLRILAEPPRAPGSLRVGYPSGNRAHLLLACEKVELALTPKAAGYDMNLAVGNWFHLLIRSEEARRHPQWPDTLSVRLFDDAADQEIALERGELDVAVFWPGELSTHMREHPRWKERLSWPLEPALIGEIPWGSTEWRCAPALRTAAAFRALGQSLFRGDLEVSPEGLASCSDTIPPNPATRFDVDPTCPGRATLERFLNRDAPEDQGASVTPIVRVSCMDPRMFSNDDAVKAAMRCQVVCAPQLLPYVRELGPGVFATLFDCVTPER